MRKKIVAGNWKMHGSRQQTESLLTAIKAGVTVSSPEIIVFPSYVFLLQTQAILTDTPISWGAQNVYIGESGAFTGEISAPMLTDCGCRYVLIGHSERRQYFHEDLALIAAKFKAAQQFGLTPILCIGETRAEREQGAMAAVITTQLNSVVEAAGISAFRHAVLAYEPVWAIGTGLTATPEQAQEAHAFIRQLLAQHEVDVANTLRILYGGSVKADNARDLFAMPDIDGGLVGGASLDAANFLKICSSL